MSGKGEIATAVVVVGARIRIFTVIAGLDVGRILGSQHRLHLGDVCADSVPLPADSVRQVVETEESLQVVLTALV